MARSRDIEYRVGFTGDTSQLEAAVKKATDSLTKLGTSPEALNRGLEGASRSALELSNHLNAAFNQNTGKLDLIKFQQSLKASGKDIQDYAATLSSIGPEGQQAFLEVASAIGKAELPLKRTNNLIKQFGQTLWNTARWRITTSAINAMVGGIQQAYGYAKSLDASLNNIRIVTGKSAEDMARFAKEANNAAKALSTTTTTYTDASLIYYQQGLNDEQVKQRTDTTIRMANVTGESAETISSEMTAIWNNFDNGTRSLESFSDGMVALGATTSASSKEIAEGLEKFAPVAQTVGLSFDYAASALTTIVAQTRESASVAGNALRTLFSRLEGLKLGETLDDGTDLNKYSSALMAVGVNIKDVQGNLKDMDTILDELGAKWQTLAKDQQMALAETVAGVRQYTQLVALMDNWSDFQQNLVTAQNSEGALQRQADIYAESWEAARKRIKASTEDIFDSLINPEQFIKLDDMFTPLLTGIVNSVDALGGLTGMLPLVVMLMNKAFGDKIAQSLRDMTVNIGLMTGAEQKRARALQDTVAETAKSLTIGYEENAVVDARVAILQEEVTLQAQINSNIDQMPIAQQAVLNSELKIVDAYKQQAVVAAELLETKKDIAENARIDIWSGASNSKGIATVEQLFGNRYQSIQNNQFIDTKNIDVVNQLDNAVASLTAQLEKAVDTSAKISHLTKTLGNTKTATEEAKNEAIKLLETYGKAPEANASIEQIRVKLKQLSTEASTARTALRTALQNLDVDPHSINVFIGAVSRLTEAGYDSEAAIEAVRRAMEKAGQTAQMSSAAFLDWADALVKIGTYASKAAMAIRAIENFKEIFSKDNDLSFSERFSQGAMSVSMMAPLIASGIKGFQNFKQNANIDFSKLTTEVEKSKLAFDAATQSVANNRQAINALNQKIGNLPKGTDPKALQQDLETLKASTQGLKNVAKQTGDEYAKLAESAKLASIASKDATIAAGLAAAAVTAIAVAVALTVKYINDYKEKVKQLNKEKMETADKAKEEISNNQNLIDSYRQLLNTYRETGEGKDQLDAKAKELAEAYNIEGASLASLTDNYEEFLATINQLNRDQLKLQQGTFLEAANAAVNYSSKKVTFGDDAADVLQEAGLYQYVKPGMTGLTLDLQLSTNSYDELLTLQKKLEAVKEDPIIGKGVTQALQEINTELEKAKDYLSSAATIEVELKAPDGSDISSFEGFKDWQEKALGILKSNSNFNTELLDTSTIIKQAALNLDLDEWVQIQNITEDIETSLKKYPSYLEKATTKFGKITSLDDAKIFEYLPWSQVDDNNFDEIYEQTKAYIKTQEIGAQTALKYADAEKLLQKIQSGSKLNTKDLKDYANLFEGGTDEFVDFLTKLSPDEQEAKLNRIMQDSFEKQQKDRTARIAEIGNQETGLLGASYTARDIARDSLAKAGFDSEESLKAVIKTVTDVQDQWDLTTIAVKNYYTELEKAKAEGKEKDFLNNPQNVNPLDAYGLNADNLDQALDQVNELFEEKLAKNPYTERVNQYQQAIDEIDRLTKEQKSTAETYQLEQASYERTTNLLVDQVKTLGELNKLQRIRKLNTDQYSKGILTLAKNIPAAAKQLDAYNKALKSGTEEEKIKALRKLSDIVDADAWGQAIGKIKTVNAELETAGMKLGDFTSAEKIDPAKYKTKLGEIAKAIREVTGATENQVNETWVENHAKEIQDILSGEVDTVNAAVGSIRLALDASSQDFTTYAQKIGIDANNIQNVVNALDGIEFDINGYADMSQVIKNLIRAGATAEQVAQLLKWISNADVGFEVENLPDFSELYPENIEDFDPVEAAKKTAHALASLQKTKLRATTKLSDIPTGYKNLSGGGGGGSNYQKDPSKDLEDTANRYHEINRELERQSRILTEIDKTIDRTYGIKKLDAYAKKQDELNDKLDLQRKKYDEAAKHLVEDREKLFSLDEQDLPVGFSDILNRYGNLTFQSLTDYGEFAGYDAEGNAIYSYQKLREEIVEKYNAKATEIADKMAQAKDKDSDELKKEKEELEKWFNDLEKWFGNYETSLDTYNTTVHEMAETKRQIEDNELNSITFKLQLALDVREIRKKANDFARQIEEAFGDALTHSAQAMAKEANNAFDLVSLWNNVNENGRNIYEQQYDDLIAQYNEALNGNSAIDTTAIIEKLENLQSEIIASGEELLAWLDQVENMFTEALDAASTRFDEFTNQLSHQTEIVGTMKELYALQGITYKTEAGFNELATASETQYKGYLNQAKANKLWLDDLAPRLEEAERLLAEANETDTNYDMLKKNRDALLAEYNETQKSMLETSKNAMETARQIALDTVDRTTYELEQRLTNNLGFDLLQDKFDHFMEENERYLDPVEEGLETAAWYSKLQVDIDKTNNKVYQNRLKDLQEEIDLRRKSNELSQYDLDILEARYQTLQAEMALEEVKDNKTQLRLTRDSQGNWNYQYTSNPENIRAREQELLKARQNEYEITKKRNKDLYSELIKMSQEYASQDAEIRKQVINGILTPEEGEARLAELERYYTDKATYLQKELGIAREDMAKAAVESEVSAAALSESVLNTSSAAIQDIVTKLKDSGIAMQQLAAADFGTLQSMLEENVSAFETAGTETKEVLQDIINGNTLPGSSLTTLRESFDEELGAAADNIRDNFVPEIQAHTETVSGYFDTMKEKVQEVANAVGVNEDSLNAMVDNASLALDNLYSSLTIAIGEISGSLDTIYAAQRAYSSWAGAVQEVVKAQSELSGDIGDNVTDKSGLGDLFVSHATSEHRNIESGPQPSVPTPLPQPPVSVSIPSPQPSKTTNPIPQSSTSIPEPKSKNIRYTEDDLRTAFLTVNSGQRMAYEYANEPFYDALTELFELTYSAYGGNKTLDEAIELIRNKYGFATGGYTGEWGDNNGRLALLHQKELVLNAQDTENILEAVHIMRGISDTIFSGIAKSLDSAGAASIALLGSQLSGVGLPSAQSTDLEQHVTIEQVNFPNVSSAREIEEAFENLVNDAAQWARRRKG